MRILTMIAAMMLFVTGWAPAAVVNLTDGRSVQGDIIKEGPKSLEISVDGVSMTYYADEIKDIDGKPFGAQQTQAAPGAVAPALPQAASNLQGISAVTPEKRALILKFIDVFGTRHALDTNFDLMMRQIAKEKPDEAQKIRERIKVDEIIDRLVPIYDRNFTQDDLKAFITFYESPEGHKLIVTMPELMRESVQESIKYMQEKFPESLQQAPSQALSNAQQGKQ